MDGDRVLNIKYHSLTGRITLPLMYQAFRSVKRNRGAAGVDRQSVGMFEANLEDNLRALMRSLKEGSFQPLPARRVYIDKGGGKLRPLGIPVVRDRVAQEVLRQLISPLFERLFHDDSYGFRPGRSAHMALERVKCLQRLGYRYVLDADISGFFDNIPHQIIMQGLTNVVADGNILRLVQRFLRAGVMEDGVLRPTTVGTPQGGVISPLLANIALNFLDWHLARSGFRLVRYADDFVVLCRSARRAKEALLVVMQKLTELGLTLSPEKTRVTDFRRGFAFLGFEFRARSAQMRTKSVERFKDKIRQMTVRKHNLDAQVIVQLNAVIRGVARYFATSFSTVREQFRYLDAWLRMRVRCMKFKRKSVHDNWRLRIRHIRRLGLLFLTDYLQPGKI
jgi:group II intron reverse transcriptase/maturase